MKLHISRGNSKIGKTPNLSLMPMQTCPPHIECWRYCYAQNSVRQYSRTREAWQDNTDMWMYTPWQFENELTGYLEKHRPFYFRYHVGGDIPDERYMDMMNRLAKRMYCTRFLAFTKTQYVSTEPNLKLIYSLELGEALEGRLNQSYAFVERKPREIVTTRPALCCPGKCEPCGRICWSLPVNWAVIFQLHGNKKNKV